MFAEDFAEVTDLNAATQRQLLFNGLPEEQVWAAWALGLALGKQAKPDLLAVFERTDHPGVRRQLVVMLAGFGERSLLVTLAESEMNDLVRATAAQYLLQTSRASDLTHLRPTVEKLLHDPSPDVRRALLVANQGGRSLLRGEDQVRLSADADVEVRGCAVETLLNSAEGA